MSTNVSVEHWGWGTDFEEEEGSLLLLHWWGGWREIIITVLELGYCLFDEKQLIVSEARLGYFSS